jgi:hypothetical protein
LTLSKIGTLARGLAFFHHFALASCCCSTIEHFEMASQTSETSASWTDSSSIGSFASKLRWNFSSFFYIDYPDQHVPVEPGPKRRKTKGHRAYVCLHCQDPPWSNRVPGNAVHHAETIHRTLVRASKAAHDTSDRNGPVWYGMEVKPYHTSCLYNNRYGLTGKTSNTAKTAKNEAASREGNILYCTTSCQSNRSHSHYPRYHCYPQPGAFHTKPGDTHKPL